MAPPTQRRSCLVAATVFAIHFASACRGPEGDGDPCSQSPLANTSSGAVVGFDKNVRDDSGKLEVVVSSFLGIPFAKPPVGSRRFHYPEPVTDVWETPRLATKQSTHCTQSHSDATVNNEDCLYLNVYTRRDVIGSSSTLPVMFWIYGGGFRNGNAYQEIMGHALYDGKRLVANHGVVIVTANYRTNALGFNTYTNGANGETGTQALADQRLALQWTANNIRAFGGDPSRVTIFGESAGAMSVMYHLVSPPSWPYFSKAIMQSGTSASEWFFQPKKDAVALYDGWASAVGCPDGPGRLSCLQALPATQFSKVPSNYTGQSPLYGAFPFGPVVDGTYHGLLDVPSNLVRTGLFARVPFMLGANRDDGTFFVPTLFNLVPGVTRKMPENHHDTELAMDWFFGASQKEEVFGVYRDEEYTSVLGDKPAAYQVELSHIIRDAMFHCSNRALAELWHSYGLQVFLYTFAFDLGELDRYFRIGDFHAADLPFVWRNDLWLPELVRRTPGVMRMGEIMSCLWTSFAYHGDPNGGPVSSTWPQNCETVHGNVTAWPAYDERRQLYNLTDRPSIAWVRDGNAYPDDVFPNVAKCDVWDRVVFPWHRPQSRVEHVWI